MDEEYLNSKKNNRNVFTHKLQITRVGQKSLQNKNFGVILLLLVMFAGIFSFSSAFSSLRNTVFIKSTGQIATVNIPARSGSPEDIQAAVDAVAAAGGGTVHVPAGTFDWDDETVRIREDDITIKGAGIDVTILNQTHDAAGGGFDDMFYFTNCENVAISYMTIKGLCTNDAGQVDGTGIMFLNCIDFRIHHCKLLDCPEAAVDVRSNNPTMACRGLIDHCIIDNPYKSIYGGAWAYGVQVKSTAYSPTYWDDDISHFLGKYETIPTASPSVYIEDCEIYRTRHTVASNQLGWYCLRYNTLDQINANSMVDIHGGRDAGNPICGGRGLEAYNNTLNHHGTGFGFFTRGGDGAIYNNTITNVPTAIRLTLDDATDPEPTRSMFLWDNTFKSVQTEYDINQAYFTEDVDYFFRAPNQEDDGFTYTPYTYPHPLVGEEEEEQPENSTVLNQPSENANIDYLNVAFNYTQIFYQGSIFNSTVGANVSDSWRARSQKAKAITV